MATLQQHADGTSNFSLKRLVEIMLQKQSNLALAADVLTTEALLQLADDCGPSICVFKTHMDIIQDFTPDTYAQLLILAEKHRFLIFEDRKFADIGQTVVHQYTQGVYKINDWADITNTHIISGEGVVDAMKPHGLAKNHGLLLLAQMSSKDNHFTSEYTKACVDLAEKHRDFVIGFICQEKLTDTPGLLHMMPGVHPSKSGDGLNQAYLTPKSALLDRQADIIIVGRGITQNDNPAEMAEQIRAESWQYAKQS